MGRRISSLVALALATDVTMQPLFKLTFVNTDFDCVEKEEREEYIYCCDPAFCS